MPLRMLYWTAFAAALAVYATMLAWTLPGISASAGGLAPFDMRPGGYDGDAARGFLDALGREGRALYQGPQRMLDLFYPALLAIVLAGAVWALVQNRPLRALLLVVVPAGMGADYLENVRVAGLLAQSGAVTDEAVAAASRATQVKSALTGLAMVAVIAALAVAGVRRVRRP